MTTLRCKVAIVGDTKVGKTAITTVFHGKQYPKNYVMTLGVDFCVKTVKIPDTDYSVELFLFDTSGHDIYSSVLPKYVEGSSMLIVVYDMTDRQSFNNCKKWVAKAMAAENKKLKGILVGTKSDLKDFAEVKTEDAMELAAELGFGFFECSAQTGKDVDMPFNCIADLFYQDYQKKVNLFMQG